MPLASEERDDSASAELERSRSDERERIRRNDRDAVRREAEFSRRRRAMRDGQHPPESGTRQDDGKPQDSSQAAKEAPQAQSTSRRARLGSPNNRQQDSLSNEKAAAEREARADGGDQQGSSGKDRLPESQRQAKRLAESTSKAATALKAAAGNRRAQIALLTTGGLVGLFMGLFFIFLQFKLISIMEMVQQHMFARNNHAFEVRQRAFMRAYLADHFKNPDSVIDDGTASFSKQVYNRLYRSGLDKKLEAEGIKEIKSRPGPGGRGKIITITDVNGQTVQYDNNLVADKRTAKIHANDLARQIIPESERSFKRFVIKTRLTQKLGAAWHPIDPIKGKYQEVREKLATRMISQMMKIPKVEEISNRLLEKFLPSDNDDSKKINERVRAAIQESIEKGTQAATSQAVYVAIAEALKAANPYFLGYMVFNISCTLTDMIQNGTIQKMAQQLAEIEQMNAFKDLAASADQIKAGGSDGTTIAAATAMTIYTDKNGKKHDVSESNNYPRGSGKAVPYKPSLDCNNPSELCDEKVPSKRLQSSTAFQALNLARGVINSPLYKYNPAGIFLPGVPGTVGTELACGIAGAVNDVLHTLTGPLMKGADAAISAIPGVGGAWTSVKGSAADILNDVNKGILETALSPTYDTATAGPFLFNIIMSGASASANTVAGGSAGDDEPTAVNNCWDQSDEEKADDTTLCGHKLSKDEVIKQNLAIADEQNREWQQSSTWTRLASLDTPRSLVSRLVLAAPSSPDMMVERTSQTMVAAINPRGWVAAISNLPNLLTGKLTAANDTNGSSYVVLEDGKDQFGQDQYGFTEDELENTDPDNPGKLKNLDEAVGCSMIATLRDAESGKPIEQPPACDKFHPQPQEVCTATGSDGGGLNQDALAKIADQYGLQSIVIQQVGGNIIQSYKGQEPPNQPASVLKLIIADVLINSDLKLDKKVQFTRDDMYAGNGSDNRKVGDTTTLDDSLKQMVGHNSSNTDANIIMRELGGPAKVTETLKSMGYKNTDIEAYFKDSTITVKNSTTAEDVSRAMSRIYQDSSNKPGYKTAQEAMRGGDWAPGSIAYKGAYAGGETTHKPVTGVSAVYESNGQKYVVTIYLNEAGGEDASSPNVEKINDAASAASELLNGVSGSTEGCSGNVNVSGDRAANNEALLSNDKLKLGNYGSAASQKNDIQKSHSDGGLVDNTVALMLAIVQHGFNLPVNSLRSDHGAEGDGDGLHNPAGAAVDVGYSSGDANGAKLYKWVYDNRKALHINMMIWAPPPSGYKCIGGGEPVDCASYFGSAYPVHNSHIHLGVYKE